MLADSFRQEFSAPRKVRHISCKLSRQILCKLTATPTLTHNSGLEALMAELKRQIPINTTPEKVFAALAPQAGLRSWWTADATADEKPSGKAEFGFDKRQMVFRMMIEKLEPSKRVVWSCHGDHPEWNGTTIIYDDPS